MCTSAFAMLQLCGVNCNSVVIRSFSFSARAPARGPRWRDGRSRLQRAQPGTPRGTIVELHRPWSAWFDGDPASPGLPRAIEYPASAGLSLGPARTAVTLFVFTPSEHAGSLAHLKSSRNDRSAGSAVPHNRTDIRCASRLPSAATALRRAPGACAGSMAAAALTGAPLPTTALTGAPLPTTAPLGAWRPPPPGDGSAREGVPRPPTRIVTGACWPPRPRPRGVEVRPLRFTS